MKQSIDDIFSISSNDDFLRLALKVYHYQKEHCSIYGDYIRSIGKDEPKTLEEIPFLPISFFKSHVVKDDSKETQLIFRSSGTGGERSQHHIADTKLYERSFNQTYDQLIGNPADQVILALLPNYLEQGESSLIYMVDHLIKRTGNKLSGFFLNNHESLLNAYREAILEGKHVVIFGVSYALLDLTELKPDLSNATIIETGGMKGRRKELTKSELHEALRKGLNCTKIASEYGMTELLSQAYSISNEIFVPAKTMRILIREVNDPFSYVEQGKTGGINVIDLANLHSCSFIETQDLGRENSKGFEVMGRFDQSDIRGCNLMVV